MSRRGCALSLLPSGPDEIRCACCTGPGLLPYSGDQTYHNGAALEAYAFWSWLPWLCAIAALVVVVRWPQLALPALIFLALISIAVAADGQRIADRVAAFGGSWPFIFVFAAVMAIWMSLNILRLASFDPYPFILLNLVLSTVAALQAPVIMMSQNRQASKDKLLAENDYQVNLKAEMEIAALLRGHAELLARLALLERTIPPWVDRRGQRREGAAAAGRQRGVSL